MPFGENDFLFGKQTLYLIFMEVQPSNVFQANCRLIFSISNNKTPEPNSNIMKRDYDKTKPNEAI